MGAAKDLVRLLILVEVIVAIAGPGAAALSMDYYAMSCPFAEYIVRNVVSEAVMGDPTLAAGLLRLHFHDCFVQGCDASVLLDSTASNTAEKDAPANKSLRGFEVIDKIKQMLEAQCPGVVSCADVLAFAARDAVLFAGGPYYGVPTGRRDGSRSVFSDTFTALPAPFLNASGLISLFSTHGFNVQDMVALSGGHTLGVAHCAAFKTRLTTETATLDSGLGSSLAATCKSGGDSATATFDRTSTAFDGVYFKELQQRRGLLTSDQTLFESPETKRLVNAFAMNQAYFFYAFQQGMLKMGQIDLKEGDHGEDAITQLDQLDSAAAYIKQLKGRIDDLKRRKERGAGGGAGAGCSSSSSAGGNTKGAPAPASLPVIEVRHQDATLDVALVSEAGKPFKLHEVIAVLEQEGAEVVSASFSVVADKIFYTLHSQALCPRIGLEADRVSQRIHGLAATAAATAAAAALSYTA